jgi:hypothetical protein
MVWRQLKDRAATIITVVAASAATTATGNSVEIPSRVRNQWARG